MKNRKFEKNVFIRWGLVIAGLLFLIFVFDKVVQVACSQLDQERMIDRNGWIQSFAVQNGRLDLPQIRDGLTSYAKRSSVQIAIYGPDRHLVYSSTGRISKTLSSKQSYIFHETKYASYYIAPIEANQQTVGYLWMKGPNTVIVGLGLLYFFFFLGGLCLLFYRDYLVRSYTVPVHFAARMAENMLDGHYKMTASDSVRRESVLRLNLAMNRLSETLNEINHSYSSQRDSMTTLTENIGNGLLFIDGNGRVDYVNKTFKEDFKTTASHWELADYQEVIPYDEVKEMIDEAFRSKKRLKKQLHLAVHIERKHFDVSCAPIMNHHKKVRGIVVVFHDISEIKKLENMRKDFVANVSHELKTPITSLIGFTETLLDGAKDDKKLETQFLNIILHEGQRLQNLIKDLLDLSKIEREHFSIEWQKVSLSKLLDAALLIFREKVDSKKITIERQPGDEGWALGDPYRIRQIMINLITNAISYTPEYGRIIISIKETMNQSRFIISDTGIGIEKDQIPRIFERFYRVDKARSRDSGGTGLGLAIVKHLVEVHEGNIDVESEPGKGTKFTISFKKTAPPIG